MPSLVIKAPAKINLGLEVGQKRRDGFHDITTIIVPLELSDSVRISLSRPGIRVATDSKEVPEAEANLAFQAADRFFQAAGIKPSADIRISKRVPVGAGLGGGSSDAAAVLLGLNRLHRKPLSDLRLRRIGLRIGSDVPALLCRKPVVARGRGERVRQIRLPRLGVLLLVPGYPVSTRWAYARLDAFRSTRKSALTSPRLLPKILGRKVRNGELASAGSRVFNSFEPVVFERHPDLARAKRLLLEHGAWAAALSGSGSTVYGLVHRTGWQDPMAALHRHGFRCLKTRSC
ncbi:MAG: 4-(cytidine 5'-diphospho)-2-C-methyl-D-erythritol kinase [candidate division WOR-3 bacterium]|nr:MAG: 4-(cytidine 5'-diphospho)-2-C-methyl-D-erythritol kinase [candidate division WOR-3 bacterium]